MPHDPFDKLIQEVVPKWPITWMEPPTAEELREAMEDAAPVTVPWLGKGDRREPEG